MSCWEQHGYTVVKKGWDGMQAVAFNQCSLVVRDPKGVKKICPKPLYHQHQPKPLVQGRPRVSLCKPVSVSCSYLTGRASAMVFCCCGPSAQQGVTVSCCCLLSAVWQTRYFLPENCHLLDIFCLFLAILCEP